MNPRAARQPWRLLYSCRMPALYLTLAALLMIAAPILVAAVVFYVAFPWWTDRLLKSDTRVQDKLRLEVSDGHVGWTIDPTYPTFQPRPYAPLACAALFGLAVIAAEAAMFATGSRVAHLWYVSGAIASGALLLLLFAVTGALKHPLGRMTERALKRQAESKFWFAAQPVVEICGIARQIDHIYASIGVNAQSDVRELCGRALLKHIRLGQDVALAQVSQIKLKAENDLRNLQYLARLLANTRITIEKAKSNPNLSDTLHGAIARIDNQVHSRELAEALEDARWSRAERLLEITVFELGRVLDVEIRDSLEPETLEDAYRILNVSDDTSLANIKAVVTTYRRIWHPDLVQSDEIKHERFTLRMQQINRAWDIIQEARAPQPEGVNEEAARVGEP